MNAWLFSSTGFHSFVIVFCFEKESEQDKKRTKEESERKGGGGGGEVIMGFTHRKIVKDLVRLEMAVPVVTSQTIINRVGQIHRRTSVSSTKSFTRVLLSLLTLYGHSILEYV